MKKFTWALLVLIAAGGTLFAAGNSQSSGKASAPQAALQPGDPFGAYPEPVIVEVGVESNTRIKYPAGDGPDNQQYIRYIKEKLNIDVKIAWAAADYVQRLNLAIASNNIPDAFRVYPAQLKELADLDLIQPMDDAIKNYASPEIKAGYALTNGIAESDVTFNGRMMAVPNVAAQADGFDLVWIRKDWIEQYGLAEPKVLEDVKSIARAFVRNGKIGIVGPSQNGAIYAAGNNGIRGFDALFNSYEAYPGYWLNQNGKAVYGSTTGETRAALQDLAALYKEGLIDREMGLRKDSAELVISGQAGIFFGTWWMGYAPLGDAIRNDPKANWQAYFLPSIKTGKYNNTMGPVTNYYTVVKKGYAHPEAIVKMVNLHRGVESTMDTTVLPISEFPLRTVVTSLDECERSFTAIRDYLSGRKTINDFSGDFGIYKGLESDLMTIKDTKLAPYDKMDIQYWNTDAGAPLNAWRRAYSIMVGVGPVVDTPFTPIYSITYGQTPTMERRWANLKKLEDETFLKIIMGVEPITAFDSFVEQWKREGGTQILTEVSALIK
ncbi:putative ABC transporter peptide-binding protein YtcQ [Spirochaetia bacterium]|nr:putative ABC transporter peptide-binding protein YtcQ [Spirochaetia bacterium]